jgi:hypothetical protein
MSPGGADGRGRTEYGKRLPSGRAGDAAGGRAGDAAGRRATIPDGPLAYAARGSADTAELSASSWPAEAEADSEAAAGGLAATAWL